ncbi:hypothetical protein OEZ85_004720 [Tetradesmus obliquus]|uniref:PsbP C-terminal domain-containing protein n=1 Tax=Tetradesmus obliquus TaxID=3088 RepID=A0ABY8UMS7_TETOB|nr:hypothetical protein OEZ85_004720 [Tetradesmus obliquus]
MALLNKTKMQVAAKATSQRAAFVRATVVVRAQKQAQEAEVVAPSQAGYGDAANVFGKVTNKSGFVPYSGEGFALLLPAKWNPSKEQDFPGTVLRYEDNFDAVNNLTVLCQTADKGSIDGYGSPEQFLDKVGYLFGKQTFTGESISEGGFAANRVSAASLLDVSEDTDKKGKKYYKYELLVRSADGDEGGRHQLIGATVSGGKLWIIKIQAGDKRWFKGTKKEAMGSFNSFTVA